MAERKLTPLAAGVDVTIIAESPHDFLDALAAQGARVILRNYEPGDLEGAFVCVASDPDPVVRAAIASEAHAKGPSEHDRLRPQLRLGGAGHRETRRPDPGHLDRWVRSADRSIGWF